MGKMEQLITTASCLKGISEVPLLIPKSQIRPGLTTVRVPLSKSPAKGQNTCKAKVVFRPNDSSFRTESTETMAISVKTTPFLSAKQPHTMAPKMLAREQEAAIKVRVQSSPTRGMKMILKQEQVQVGSRLFNNEIRNKHTNTRLESNSATDSSFGLGSCGGEERTSVEGPCSVRMMDCQGASSLSVSCFRCVSIMDPPTKHAPQTKANRLLTLRSLSVTVVEKRSNPLKI